MVAVFALTFICIGFDYLREVLERNVQSRVAARKDAEDYQSYSDKRDQRKRFADTYSAERDFVGPSSSSNKKYSDGTYF